MRRKALMLRCGAGRRLRFAGVRGLPGIAVGQRTPLRTVFRWDSRVLGVRMCVPAAALERNTVGIRIFLRAWLWFSGGLF